MFNIVARCYHTVVIGDIADESYHRRGRQHAASAKTCVAQEMVEEYIGCRDAIDSEDGSAFIRHGQSTSMSLALMAAVWFTVVVVDGLVGIC